MMNKDIIKIVKNFQEKHNLNFNNYFDLKIIEDEITSLFKDCIKASGKNIYGPIEFAKDLGFDLYLTSFKKEDKEQRCIIGKAKNNIENYKSNQVILLSRDYLDEDILFALSHELIKYIFEYPVDVFSSIYVSKYTEKKNFSNEEARICRCTQIIIDNSIGYNFCNGKEYSVCISTRL